MTFSAKKFFLSKFMLWFVVVLGGSYYLLPNLFVPSAKNRFALSKVKLGIDLRGGTYITLGVEIEKAIENRLAGESKNLDAIFKEANYRPSKKEIDKKNLAIVMNFKDSEDAKRAYNLVRKESSLLRPNIKGTSVVAPLTPAEETRLRNDSVEQAVQVISNRINNMGVEGPIVQRHGSSQIVVQIPGVDDPERIKNLITKRAHLEFKVIQDVGSKESILDKFDGDLPSDKMLLAGERASEYEDDETEGRWYLVSAFPDLTGDHIEESKVIYDEFGRPEVGFRLDRSGGRIFKDLTRNNIGRQIGIIIDNVVYSAPEVNTEVGREGSIRLGRTAGFETAKDLAIVLKTGAFQAPVKYQEERRIGPSLGQDSINRGLISCLIGLSLVFIFSLFYYKVAGLFAMLALLFNLFIILLFLSYFGATLTLSGIAGMTLTIGMAIDASILIYEKIKEELVEGVAFRSAVDRGFKGAMSVILDSNITTFLTGLILFYFGGPSIRGFAVTLMLGIVATIISGIYFLKSLFDFVLDNTNFKSIKL
ncbi:protein translocase subunit SecD [Candidatus Babeliales bacterium]|nr:protein translocase subunit SecD [Candidatus Babeliales bacterium]